MEPYLYTGNNPIMFTDPTGMSKVPKYAYLAVSLGNTLPNGNFKFRADNVAHFRKFVKPIYSHSGGIKNLLDNVSRSVGYSQTSGLIPLMRGRSVPSDKLYNQPDKEIMFMAIFSHGARGIWGDGYDITKSDLGMIKSYIKDGKLKFNENALIYLGACNAGTDHDGSGSFAQELANVSGASVIGMMNDGVAPKGAENSESSMIYGPKMGENEGGAFYMFKKGKDPELIGKKVDVIKLIDQQKRKED